MAGAAGAGDCAKAPAQKAAAANKARMDFMVNLLGLTARSRVARALRGPDPAAQVT